MAGLFHPLLCSFCGFTALFPKGTVLLQLLLHVCSKELLSFAYFQLLTDNVSYSLGNAGKKKTKCVDCCCLSRRPSCMFLS